MSNHKELRTAFVEGAVWRNTKTTTGGMVEAMADRNWMEMEARLRYPAPTVTRPRIRIVGGLPYRVVDGVLQVGNLGRATWAVSGQNTVLQAFVDLLANPTETVEVDDA